MFYEDFLPSRLTIYIFSFHLDIKYEFIQKMSNEKNLTLQ